MFGLGLVSNLIGGSGPTKAEKKETELKEAEQKEQREREERDLDAKKRAYDAEGGTGTPDNKENKAKVCMSFG
jgi:hypothetical protein